MAQGPLQKTCAHTTLLLVAALALSASSCARLPRRAGSVEGRHSSTTATEERTNAARVNINTASADDLEKLPGIGRVLSERIVTHREKYGPFRRAEHLMMVQGISDHKFRTIQASVSIE